MTSNSSLAFNINSKAKPINLVDPTKLLNSHPEFLSTSFTEATKATEKAQHELTWLRKTLVNDSNQDDLPNHLNFKNSLLFHSANNFADKYYSSLKNNQNMETR